jgi:hypothetical protein
MENSTQAQDSQKIESQSQEPAVNSHSMGSVGSMGFMGGLVCGAALGVGLLFMLDPVSGRRRRSLLRDKMTKMTNDLGDMTARQGRHLRNKAKGIKAKAFRGSESQRRSQGQETVPRQQQMEQQHMQ